MTRGTQTARRCGALAFVVALFGLSLPAAADESSDDAPPVIVAPPGGEVGSESPRVDRTDVSDDGVPDEAVEPSEAVSEVEVAMEKVESEIEEGLPAEFTIEFGDTHDWLRLTSGEWLKGKIKRMREDEIEFDSDKLNLVKFNWEKVDQLHSPRINTYVFEDKVDVVGRAVVTNEEVLVETVDGVKKYPRIELLSIVEGEPRERNFWSTRLSAGFSGSAGNTNQGQFNGHWDLRRADQRTLSLLSYDGTFGFANDAQTVNRHVGRIDVKLFISRRFFFVPVTSQFVNDQFANLKFRATPGAGAGVHVFDTKKVEWDVGGALGYQFTNFLSTAAGAKNPQNDGFVSIQTYADIDFTGDVELILKWRTSIVYTEIGLTNHYGSAKFSVEVTDIFDFEGTFNFYRTENPPPRSDGTVPEKNDYEVIVGLALEIG
ncbi:MAG: DUF481 domain-containing protein [Polyangiales bacterium]